jgi:outer membrane protein
MNDQRPRMAATGFGGVRVARFTLALLVPGALFSPFAHGADLLQMYKAAHDHDAKFQGSTYQRDAAEQALPQAKAGYRPTVSLSWQHTDETQNIISSDNSLFQQGTTSFPIDEYTLSLSQPIFNYPAWVRIRQARSEVKRADAEFATAEQDLIMRVSEAYLGVLAAQDNVTFAEAEKNAVGRQLELVRAKLGGGLARITDLHDAEARYASVEAREIEAKNLLDDSQQALKQVTGALPDHLAGLKGDLRLIRPDPVDVKRWVSAALEQNPAVAMKMFDADVAREEVTRQKAGHYPTLDLQARLNHRKTQGTLFGGGSEVETTDYLVTFNLPLYQGGFVSSRTKQAAYQHQKVLQDLDDERRTVMREARAAYFGVISSISKVKALHQSVVSQNLALEAKRDGYRSGLYTALAVLDAQRDLYMAKRDYAKARYDYLLNTLRLKHAAGTLGEADVVYVNHWLK